MTDANETAWTAEGGKAIPNAVNESGDGVVEEASRASGGFIGGSYA